MPRSALPLLLVAFFALLIAALGWLLLREPPTGGGPSATTPSSTDPTSSPPGDDDAAPARSADETSAAVPEPAREQARVEVTGRTVRGRVKCDDGELPASGLEAYLLTRAPRFGVPTTIEDGLLAKTAVNADGSFEIGPLPAGWFYLHAEGEEHVQDEPQHLDPAHLGDEPVILRVRRACAIEGLVHARDGGPINGALVAVGNESDLMGAIGLDAEELIDELESTPEDSGAPVDPEAADRQKHEKREALAAASEQISAATDAGGRFRLARLKNGDGMLVTITAPGFARYRQVVTSLRPGKALFVDAELEPAGRFRGTVVDESGAPIANANVHALRSDKLLEGLLGGGLAYDRTRTDLRGEYVLDHLAAGPYRVEARVKGWPPQLKPEVVLGAGQELGGVDFVLDAGAIITGVVVDAADHPIEGATVQAVEPPSLTDLLSFTRMIQRGKPNQTDAQGRFEVRGLARAKHTVTASADRHVAGKLADVMPGGPPITLRLGTPGSIAGVVVSTTTGEPVPSYRVTAEVQREPAPREGLASMTINLDSLMESGSERHEKSFADPEGRFTLEDLRSGTARLEVHADRHGPAGVAGIPVKEGETTKGVIVFLEPEGLIEGRVRDARTKQPLQASITVSMDGDEQRPAEPGSVWRKFIPATEAVKQADDEGRFVIDGLPRGPARVRAGREGYRQSEPLSLVIVPGKTASDLVFELTESVPEPKGHIEGVVLTAAGKPRKGAMVFVSRRGTLDDMDDPVITDGRGSFEVRDVTAGRTNLMVVQGDGNLNAMSLVSMFTRRKLVPVEVKANETVHVEIREDGQAPKGCRVHGTVRSGGQPLPGAMIFAFAEHGHDGLKTAAADEAGHYEIADMAPGRWRFAVAQDMSAMTSGSGVPVTVPDAAEAEQDLAMPEGKLTGRVVDATTHAPLAGVTVFAIPEDLAPSSLLASAFDHGEDVQVTDGNGAFALGSLSPGNYTLRAGGPSSRGAAAEYAQAVMSGVALASQGTAPIEIALRKGGVVSGVVRDQSGATLREVSILLRDEAGNLVDSSRGVTTDGAGHYRYAGLHEGRCYLIAVWGDQATQASEMFETGAGKEAVIDFTLARGVPVTVRVTKLPPEISFGEVDVQATDARGRVFRHVVTEEMLEQWLLGGFTPGEYRLGPYPPGEYRIEVRKGEAIVYSRSAVLKNPEGETFEIDATRPN